MVYTNFIIELCFTEPELLPIEILHHGKKEIFNHFCSCDLDLEPITFTYKPDPYPLDIYQYWMCK